jgi:hypothetical protein
VIRRYTGTITLLDLYGTPYTTHPTSARAESAEGAADKITDRLDFEGYARHEWTLSELTQARE